ncbi:hypothetical protein PMAYCL1PPCAC_30265, partial [Pristionchus mayeri]
KQIITYWKYPFDEYVTQTEDGYLIKLFRIKHGRSSSDSVGAPFLLAHGLAASAEHLLTNPPGEQSSFSSCRRWFRRVANQLSRSETLKKSCEI